MAENELILAFSSQLLAKGRYYPKRKQVEVCLHG
jgi:hypothetical protein